MLNHRLRNYCRLFSFSMGRKRAKTNLTDNIPNNCYSTPSNSLASIERQRQPKKYRSDNEIVAYDQDNLGQSPGDITKMGVLYNKSSRKPKKQLTEVDVATDLDVATVDVFSEQVETISNNLQRHSKRNNQNKEPHGSKQVKIDPEQKRKEQERNTAQKRLARMDPEYRRREQERNTLSKRLARMDPDYRKKEQERNTESKRRARLDPDYRKREQERSKFAHQMAKLGLNPDGSLRVDRTKYKDRFNLARSEVERAPLKMNHASAIRVVSMPGVPNVQCVEIPHLRNGDVNSSYVSDLHCELDPVAEVIIASSSPIQLEECQESSNCDDEIQNTDADFNGNTNSPTNSYKNFQNNVTLIHQTDNALQKMPSTTSAQLIPGINPQIECGAEMMELSENSEINESNEEVIYLRI